MWRRLRLLTSPACAALLAAAPAGGALDRPARSLAAPEILLVYGVGLREPRAIADQLENMTLLQSLGPASPLPPGPAPPAERRAPLNLALFWGREWRATAQSAERLRALRPDQATQRGWYYPAHGAAPALISLGGGFQAVSENGLAVLRRHGVPTRTP